MSHYMYQAREKDNQRFDGTGPVTGQLVAESPEELILKIAETIIPLGDGRARLRDVSRFIQHMVERREAQITREVAWALTSKDTTFP